MSNPTHTKGPFHVFKDAYGSPKSVVSQLRYEHGEITSIPQLAMSFGYLSGSAGW